MSRKGRQKKTRWENFKQWYAPKAKYFYVLVGVVILVLIFTSNRTTRVFGDQGEDANYVQHKGFITSWIQNLLHENLHLDYTLANMEMAEPLPSPAAGEANFNYADVDGLTAEFLNVGQADCILMYNNGEAILVDGGNYYDGPLVADYLKSIGIRHLDMVVATHAHEDHAGGIGNIIPEFDIDYIMLPLYGADTPSYSKVLDVSQASTATTVYPTVGDRYQFGEAVITVISCEPATDPEDLNQSSIVLRVDYKDSSFLLTGDATVETEEAILSRDPPLDVDVDVLKVGHHGSVSSTSISFLAATSPEIAVISCFEGNEYDHPHMTTLEKLEQITSNVYRTDKLGTIRVWTDGKEYEVSCLDTRTDYIEE